MTLVQHVWKHLSCTQVLVLLLLTGLGCKGWCSSCPRPAGPPVPSQPLASHIVHREDEPIWCLDKASLTLKLAYLQHWPTFYFLGLTHILALPALLMPTFTKFQLLSGPFGISYSWKAHTVKTMVFLVVMWGCESWTIKKSESQRIDAFKLWCLEKTLESPLDRKEIKQVNPKENQTWIFIERTDAEAEAPILWPPGGKSWLIGKDPDAGKDWGQKEKEVMEDEMGWMASPTQCTLDWANSRRWWRSGKPDVLQAVGSQKVRHKWVNAPQQLRRGRPE